MKQVVLNSRTFSDKCRKEIKEYLPEMAFHSLPKAVPGIGKVYFIYSVGRTKLGQCFKQDGTMVLNIL